MSRNPSRGAAPVFKMRHAAAALVVGVAIMAGCATSDPLFKPSFADLARPAPDSFDVEVVTSAGTFDLRLYRDWAPIGVDRAFYLFRHNYYAGTRFYRVIDGFVAQFGGTPHAALDSIWNAMPLNDEPVRASNRRGTIAYARAGARTRSATMYINLEDNTRLDSLDSGGVVGYPPFGRVVRGMAVVDSLYSGYGPAPMRFSRDIQALRNDFPRLDSIASTRVTRMY
jgi:cyclophilin family peptidyl-prolyl cis-trans isomerase